MTGGPPACVSSDNGVDITTVRPHVNARGRERQGLMGMATPFPLGPTWQRQGRGKRGMAANEGARAGDGAGEGEQGSPERLTPAASAFGGGGWRVDGVHGVTP